MIVRRSSGFASIHPYECKQSVANACESITNKTILTIQDSLANESDTAKHLKMGFTAHAMCSRFFRKEFASIRNILKGIRKYS